MKGGMCQVSPPPPPPFPPIASVFSLFVRRCQRVENKTAPGRGEERGGGGTGARKDKTGGRRREGVWESVTCLSNRDAGKQREDR